MKGRVATCAAAVLLASVLVAERAHAVERIQDGGFDAATCDMSNCASPNWTETETETTWGIGPICRSGTDSCEFLSNTPFSPPNWARLGAAGDAAGPVGNTSSVAQAVEIPAAPATLRFQLRIVPTPANTGSFTVSLAGSTLFNATHETAGFSSYAPVSIDVSDFAGGSPTLQFTGSGHASATQPPSFDIDDVSLDAPDVGAGGEPGGAPETTITGKPSDKTKKRFATFRFISSAEGSTFSCAVDGQALKVPCASPYTVKVKPGKHTFQVQATDPAGNKDPTPATDDWKRKKRKKK